MSSGRAVRLAIAAGLTLGCLLAYGVLRDWRLFESLEGAALDLRFQVRGERAPGPETVLVMIDEATLAARGGWPLSRGLLAEALAATFEWGARVAALDLLIDSWRSPSGAPPAAEAAPSDPGDLALLKAVETHGARLVLPYAFVYEPGQRSAPPPDSLERAAYAVHRLPAGIAEPSPHPLGVVTPPPALLDAAVPAYVNVLLDSAGRLRLAHPALPFGDRFYPSLAVEAVRLYLGLPRESMTLLVGEGLRIEERLVPTDRLLRFGIDYYGPTGSFSTYSLLDLLEGRLAPGALENKLVVIGVAALAVGDRFVTPFSRALPGAEYFATVIDNLLHGRILRRDALASGLDVLAILLCAAAGASLHGVRRIELAGVLALALPGLWAAASYFAFAERSLWLDLTFPTLALILNAGYAMTARLFAERRGQEALARYLPPLAVRRAGGIKDAQPDTRLAAILFVDMRGFTTRSQDLQPAETMTLMRGLHRRIEQAITANGGSVDKFLGDGAMASFGLGGSATAGRDALRAARALARAIATWSAELEASGQPPLAIGIGVHLGPVVVGEAGGEKHGEVAVTGDTVNLASRLQEVSREQKATIVISDAVAEAARSAGEALDGFTPLPTQQVRGRHGTVTLWAWRAAALPG